MRQKDLSFLFLAILFLTLYSCKSRTADIILINGFVHTVDAEGNIEQAIALADGKIVAVGTSDELLADFKAKNVIDLKGKPVYPGFIDAHCHFYGYAISLNQVDLSTTGSYEEVISLVDSFAQNYNNGWILGRGWDQNKWDIRDFPNNKELNRKFPNRPVLLKRIDGHAAVANAAALRQANITTATSISGGLIGTKGGRLTGLLIDNAVDAVEKVIPETPDSIIAMALLRAEKNCHEVGLTTLDDAGLDKRIIDIIDSLQKIDSLKIRIYAMANPTDENLEHYFAAGHYKTDRLNVRSFKIYADGALGSRGACLLRPYNDEVNNNRGFLLKSRKYYKEIAQKLFDNGFQMNTHCIGDSANRMITRIYGDILGGENDLRWRVEHVQVVHPSDFPRFKNFNIIPSVQPTHATSDMYWAEDRLGKTRIKGAYAYKTLSEQNPNIAFGSDFPVESINPILGFYAAVFRKDLTGYPFDGFNMAQAVSRTEALKAMTIGAAFANFEENEKGSLEAGKFADLVVLDTDIIFADEKEVPKAKVLYTIQGGKIVYQADLE